MGYAGTKEGMQELLADAQAISGIEYDVSSYADIVDAIHVIQTEMGITGTTALEADQTIQGSAGAMAAAYQNLVTGLADENADIEGLFDALINSVMTALQGNMIPRIKTALNGISKLVKTGLPKILDILPGIVMDVLPDLVDTVSEMVTTILESISENSERLVDVIMMLVDLVVNLLLENLPMLLETLVVVITSLLNAITERLPELIPIFINAVGMIVNTLMENAPMLLQAALTLIVTLAMGLIEYLPKLVEQLPTIIETIVSTLVGMSSQLVEAALLLIIALAAGLLAAIPQLVEKIPDILGAMVSGFMKGVSQFGKIGADLLAGLWNGMSEKIDWLNEKLKGFGAGVVNKLKSIFGIHSPSKVMAEMGKFIDEGFADGITDNLDMVERSMDDMQGVIDGATPSMTVSASPQPGYGANAGQIVIPVYIGQDLIETIVVNALDKSNYRSGGR